MSQELVIFKLFGEALALGLLVGAERYRGRDPGEQKTAGVRTFATFCLLGAICGLIGTTVLTAVTFVAVAALVLVGYWRSPVASLGMTTEFAALLVFWIGYLLNSHEMEAVSLGVVLTIFLASKRTLHNFVRDQISEAEFAGTWLLSRRLKNQEDVELPLQNPYSVRPALKFGLFFIGILLLVKAASFGLGDRGILLASAIGGLGSTSAVALSVSKMLGQGSLSPLVATGSVLAAIAAGTISKWVLSLLNGTRQMALWLGGGLLTMLATAFLLLYVGA